MAQQPSPGFPDRNKAVWLDDSEHSINYSGNWVELSREGVYKSTLRSTQEVGASFSVFYEGPAYVFINVTLPMCEGVAFAYKSYIRGEGEGDAAHIPLCAPGPSDINMYELMWSLDGRSGTFEFVIEWLAGGSSTPLMLDSVGILPVPYEGSSSLTPSPTLSPTSTPGPAVTSNLPSNNIPSSSSSKATPTWSIFLIVGIVVVGLAALFVFLIRRWKMKGKHMRKWGIRTRRQKISDQERTMVEIKDDSSTPSPVCATLAIAATHSQLGLLDANDSNSLFSPISYDARNLPSTADTSCILGQSPKHDCCFCPSCDDSRSRVTHSQDSIVTSMGNSSITAVGTNTSRADSSLGSHTACSVYSNPFGDD
ncbi:hypothetical protein CVT24_007062 [Panaeolus cyanescens]|uniref:Uncharacterized protein n=1 Tax=Panaeolus cyanescens TaxID=181874 RepID=A0A409VJU7_9AGAR|nr:hypothetical protein CVT24_007062 [Panaeolus cyanescens]